MSRGLERRNPVLYSGKSSAGGPSHCFCSFAGVSRLHGKRLVAPKRPCELPKEKPGFALGEIVKAAWQPPPPPNLISRGAAWRRPVLKMPCEGHEKIRAFSLFLFALPECQGWVAKGPVSGQPPNSLRIGGGGVSVLKGAPPPSIDPPGN